MMNRLQSNSSGQLSVRFGLILGLLALIAIALFVGSMTIIQRQSRAAAALQLALETAAIGQRLDQQALRRHYNAADNATAIEADMAAFAANLATLQAGDISQNISPPSAEMGATLAAIETDWTVIQANLVELLADPDAAGALNEAGAGLQSQAASFAELTNLYEAQVAAAQTLLLLLIPIIALTGIIVFAMLLWLVRRILRQVATMNGVFAAVAEGNYTERAQQISNDELGTMALNLNNMLDHTTALIDSQSERDQLQQSIMKLLAEVAEVANGDLTVEAEVTSEITGAIADSFNYMIGQLRDVIGNVQSTTHVVRLSASEAQNSTESLAERSALQSERIAATSTEISGMAAEIRNVSKRATHSAEVGAQARATAIEGSQAVSDTINGMERIRNQVQETSRRMKRLGESSQEIGEIVQIINDIADRTAILALNASIQAAMAGDAGRGFGVVAQEVEQLAERATESTRRIDALVKAIQSETKEAVTAMESTTSEVVRGSELALQAGQALGNIESVSTELAEMINTISQDTQRQAEESEEIANSINEISELIRENAAGTQKTAQTINGMAQQAEELRSSLETFKLPALNGRR